MTAEPIAVETERLDLPMVRDESLAVADMLRLAIDKGVSVEALEKLVMLHERVMAQRAMAEFNRAMAEFQNECPPIQKTSTANIVTKSGVRFSYPYAELDEIANTVRPHLHKLGLSYSWDSKFEAQTVHCTCTLRHANGHSVTASFSAPTDASAHMNDTQKVAAALSYARRQSLAQALGLTTTDPDPDMEGSAETITNEQAASLAALLDEVKADAARFLKLMGVERLADIRAAQYDTGVRFLEAKRQGAANAKREQA